MSWWILGATAAEADAADMRTTMLFAVGLVLVLIHGYFVWRWWSLRRLAALPPVEGTIRAIHDVPNSDGMGSRKMMVFDYTPATGPAAGKPMSGTAPVRTIARYETVVGQRIAVHLDPTDPERFMTSVAGNPWVPRIVALLLMDAVLAVLVATGSLG